MVILAGAHSSHLVRQSNTMQSAEAPAPRAGASREAPQADTPRPARKSFFRRFGRLIFLVLGAGAIFGLITAIGPAKVWAILRGAGMWLPLILAIDVTWLLFEQQAVRILMGSASQRISAGTWRRAFLVHYVTFMLVPMGRTSAEVARASLLAHHLGRAHAATIAALMQALTMMANGLVCVCALVLLLLTARSHGLVVGLSINIAVMGGIGCISYLVMQHVRIGGFLGDRFSKLREAGPSMDAHFRKSKAHHLPAFLVCVLARLVQTAQFAVVLFAVTQHATVSSAFIAQGIQLVGKSAGDMVPNQVGVTEGAFTLFADALGLSTAVAQAVSIALLVRVSNITVTALCALYLQFQPSQASVPAAHG